MKKTLSLILAVMMLLGAFSITAFADMIYIDEVHVTVSNYNPTDYTIDVDVPDGVAYFIKNVGIYFLDGNSLVCGHRLNDNKWWGYGSLYYNYEGDVAPCDVSGYRSIAIIEVSAPEMGFPPDPEQDDYMFNNVSAAYVNGTAMTKVESETFEDGTYRVDYHNINIYIDPTPYTAPAGKSDSTDITLTVAKALTYDMVIPEDVTNLNAAGIYSVGQAKVANVKNATDKTVISYTATTTDFTSEGKTAIPASYYIDEAGQNAFPTTAVEVYKNKVDTENIPTMYVGISESDWDAAENGTYAATVTFNFEAKEEEEKNEWVITFNDADLGSLEYWVPKPFTAATAEGATAETQYTYTIEGESSDFDIGYGQDIITFAVLDSCPIECTQVTITVTFLEDATHKETSKSAVFTFNIIG